MKEINLPPFYVGQRVVAINDGNDKITTVVHKGQEFVILDIYQCSACNKWKVDIGHLTHSSCTSCKCGKIKHGNIKWAAAEIFAPIQETFQSITLEKVLETETRLLGVN